MTTHSWQAGGGTLFTEPILVVSQQAKIIEATHEFGVFDGHGRPLGSVVEIDRRRFRKFIRVLTKYDKNLTHTFEVRDMGGSVVLKVTRPAKDVKSRFVVTRADETPIGEIIQENVDGHLCFSFVANGRPIGGIRAENWRAWNFSITDDRGAEIARVTKTFGGRVKESFTTADNYVVEMHRHVAGPLASMVVAAALTIDTALRRNEGDEGQT
jgi:uncharacterized protein YxjI